ncbi:MAG: gamma carbonic anhydrase family protein [Clostridia bacterium]|jgi:carbonic anhydrase/acetyltransferase-like protein (isoleucine patch superfamily)|nr:gamma carbonic anhydrase family protein [Clostridiales bacterium]
MIKGYRGKKPQINERAFAAEDTVIIGDFSMGEYSSLWYGTIARADVDRITIGSYTNIQDGCIIHCSPGFPTVVGDYVTVGHGAVIHGCNIENNCLIGMGAVLMDGVEIGEYSIVGAGALITPGKKIPPESVVMGSPGKVVRSITDSEKEEIREHALGYVKLAREIWR